MRIIGFSFQTRPFMLEIVKWNGVWIVGYVVQMGGVWTARLMRPWGKSASIRKIGPLGVVRLAD